MSASPGLVCALSPFMCLPSCVSVSGGVRLSGSCLCLVSLHLSPFMCLPEWWCPLGRRKIWLAGSSLFPHVFPQTVYCRGSQFFLKRCPPLCYWPCPPLWVCRFVCLPSFVSLHVSFWVVVSGSLGLSLYLFPFICLPSCVLLGAGVRLSGSLALFVSLQLSPFMCPSGWWCPAFWVSRFICLPSFVSLHVSFWLVLSGFLCFSLYLSPFSCLP